MSSFKSSENIQKKKGGPDCTVSTLSSVILNELAVEARESILTLHRHVRIIGEWGREDRSLVGSWSHFELNGFIALNASGIFLFPIFNLTTPALRF